MPSRCAGDHYFSLIPDSDRALPAVSQTEPADRPSVESDQSNLSADQFRRCRFWLWESIECSVPGLGFWRWDDFAENGLKRMVLFR